LTNTKVVNGVRQDLTASEQTAFDAQSKVWTVADVANEFERRVAAGFSYQNNLWQIDATSLVLIGGAAAAAREYILAGGLPTTTDWVETGTDMTWTAMDNSAVAFTSSEFITFGIAVVAWRNKLHKAKKAIEDTTPIPDPTTSTEWPSVT